MDNREVGLGRELTTLEFSVLGVLLKLGSCRAHAVVLEFSTSSTLAYRSKAGSVYPLLSRLARAGLVTYEGKRYGLSGSGRKALQAWLRPPFPPGEVSTSLDLLRSRVYFLDVLSDDERLAFLDSAEVELCRLREKIGALIAEHGKVGDRFGELAMIGAVKETDARLSWIREVRKELLREPKAR